MQPEPDIVLRDIHRVPAPPMWPPAPGWWLLLGASIVMAMVAWGWLRRRRRRREAIARMFDEAMRDAGDAQARVAAMSSLLRRADSRGCCSSRGCCCAWRRRGRRCLARYRRRPKVVVT